MASSLPPADLVVDPWATTPQKTGEALLANVSLPEEYNTAFKCSRPVSGKISLNTLQKVISLTGLPATTIEKIIHMVVPPDQALLSKNEFNLALAFVAFAQKNMDVTFDNVLLHRADLPAPSLPNIESLAITRDSNDLSAATTSYARPSSSLEADPWRHSLDKVSETSTLRQRAARPSISQIFNEANFPAGTPPTSSARFSDHSTKSPILATSTNTGAARREPFHWLLKLDTISLTISPNLGGTVFKHVNFAIHSQTHDVTVLRRYSDFCWLLEVLTKRYPFRLLPNLPPKKIGIDESFMNKRRHGLLRFINFVGRHPVLGEDPLFVAFLTEQNDMATYRRTHATTLEEEYHNGPSPDTLNPVEGLAITPNLDECLEKVRAMAPKSLEHYVGLCAFMDRVAMRQEASAADFSRFGLALNSLVENERECHVKDCRNCEQVMAGCLNTSVHMQQASRLMEDQVLYFNFGIHESRIWHSIELFSGPAKNGDNIGSLRFKARSALENVVENLKRHRDLLVSMQELLERRDKQLETVNIENISKRIAVNEAKITAIESAGGGGELAEKDMVKFKAAIVSDQAELDYHAQRRTFIYRCMSTELSYFHKSRAFTSLTFQQYAEEQTKFTEKILKVWKSLTELTNEMPQDADGFL